MESDTVLTNELTNATYKAELKGKITVKRFLWHCGAKRTNERKVRGIWLTDVQIKDRNKWLLAKIKYGF